MIYIENKKKKEKTLLAKYPNAKIIDVTSKAQTALVKLSPFYPHGEIPVPFSLPETPALPANVLTSPDGVILRIK